MVCHVNDKTYIWEKNIIHNCPFTVVKEVELNVTNTFAMSKDLFFQIKRVFNECNMKIFESTEGLFFTDNKDSYTLPKLNRDLNLEHHIMLSDLDKKSFNILEIMDNLVSGGTDWSVNNENPHLKDLINGIRRVCDKFESLN